MTESDLNFFTELAGGDLDVGFGKQYNMFCFEQGILIAEALETEQNIIDFNKLLSFDEQKRLVPGLSDDHSGNTFSMSCRAAMSYLPRLKSVRRDRTLKQLLDEVNEKSEAGN